MKGKEKIRESIRSNYANVALKGSSGGCCSGGCSCSGAPIECRRIISPNRV